MAKTLIINFGGFNVNNWPNHQEINYPACNESSLKHSFNAVKTDPECKKIVFIICFSKRASFVRCGIILRMIAKHCKVSDIKSIFLFVKRDKWTSARGRKIKQFSGWLYKATIAQREHVCIRYEHWGVTADLELNPANTRLIHEFVNT